MKIRKIFFYISLGIGIFFLLLMTIGFACMFMSCSSIDREINNYGKWEQLEHAVPCFPDEIDESATINDYYYRREEAFGTPGIEILLDISYTSEGLEAEIERLENLEYTSRIIETTRKLKYDEAVLFNYPTFVAVYNEGGNYEYASIDKENSRVIYVYFQRMFYEDLFTDVSYLPKNIAINENEETEDGYFFAIDTYNGGTGNWPE